ncbi:hypothetical protein M3Y97_00976300 [Aphelenchoides bicaudatus]|nr:hypothetical protein M3Y97_00976300 [Aphelenchoides bicaudatus]
MGRNTVAPQPGDVELSPRPKTHSERMPNSRTSSFRSLQDAISAKFRGIREEGNFTLESLLSKAFDTTFLGCTKLFHTRTRFLVMILVLLCLASVWSNILSFNFAVICFIKEPLTGNQTGLLFNETTPVATQFTLHERSYLTSAVAASALIANFVVVSLVGRFGIRTVFTFLGLVSAAATFFMPTAVVLGFYYTLGARVAQGIAFAANFPWTYYKQNGLFVSVLVAYVQFSPSLTMPISGALCESQWKWPSVFYGHAIVSTVLFILFGIFYRNSPKKHPFVGTLELNKIAVGKSSLSKDQLRQIPYGAILSTASVWAVWLAACGNFVAANIMFLYSPVYMNKVLKFPVHQSGISSAIAPMAQFCLKLFAGFTSDKVRCLSETNKLRVYNSIAFFGCATFLTILAFAPTNLPYLCLAIFGCSAGSLGFTTGGFFKAAPLVSKHYSHFVTGNISMGITATMLIVPFIVDGLTPNNAPEEWRYVFLVAAGILCAADLLFVIMCSANPASWTTDEFSREASSKRGHHSTVAHTSAKHLGPQMTIG